MILLVFASVWDCVRAFFCVMNLPVVSVVPSCNGNPLLMRQIVSFQKKYFIDDFALI